MVTSLEAGRDFLTRAIISSLMKGSGFWEGNFPTEPQVERNHVFFMCLLECYMARWCNQDIACLAESIFLQVNRNSWHKK